MTFAGVFHRAMPSKFQSGLNISFAFIISFFFAPAVCGQQAGAPQPTAPMSSASKRRKLVPLDRAEREPDRQARAPLIRESRLCGRLLRSCSTASAALTLMR